MELRESRETLKMFRCISLQSNRTQYLHHSWYLASSSALPCLPSCPTLWVYSISQYFIPGFQS